LKGKTIWSEMNQKMKLIVFAIKFLLKTLILEFVAYTNLLILLVFRFRQFEW